MMVKNECFRDLMPRVTRDCLSLISSSEQFRSESLSFHFVRGMPLIIPG